MCLVGTGRSFKSINIFFPIQGEKFSLKPAGEGVWFFFREWVSCMDVSSSGGVVCVCCSACVSAEPKPRFLQPVSFLYMSVFSRELVKSQDQT